MYNDAQDEGLLPWLSIATKKSRLAQGRVLVMTIDDDLRHITGIGKQEEADMTKRAYEGDSASVLAQENAAATGGAKKPVDPQKELARRSRRIERALGSSFDTEGLSDWENVVGKGGKKKRPKQRKPRVIKGVAIASGVGALTAIIVAILLFLASSSLKLTSIITNLHNKYGATTSDAVNKEVDNLFNRYIVKDVIPSINRGTCHATIDPACVVEPEGTEGPVGALMVAWSQGHLENKLANKFGIVMGKQGNNFYINVNGENIGNRDQFKLLQEGKISIFDLNGTNRVSRTEFRKIVNDALKQGTLWDRTYNRFKVIKLLEQKFGVKPCVIACNLRDKFTDKTEDKKLIAMATVVNRTITPLNEGYGLIIQCVFGGAQFCDDSLTGAEPGDNEKLSPFQKQMQQQLQDYAAKLGGDAVKDLVKQAQAISKVGFKQYFAQQTAKKIGALFGKDISGEAAAKAVPIVGWVELIAKVLQEGEDLGPTLKHMSYAVNSAAAVSLFEAENTVVSEAKTGHMDATELGSFTQALSTNLDGSSTNQSDATSTPLYNNLFDSNGASPSTALLDDLLPGTAYAAAKTSANGPSYKCDDGKPVPAGKLVCPEEVLDRGNQVATDISNFTNTVIDAIPGLSTLITIINDVGNVTGSVFGTAFNGLCNSVGFVVGCPPIMNFIGDKAQEFMTFITSKMLSNPFSTNMSGGRTLDMSAAGADKAYNDSCHEQLGCAQASPQEVTAIQNQEQSNEQADFNHLSLFARLFSTNSPYSLISRIAVDMPSSPSTLITNGANTFFSSPLSKISLIFSSLFSSNHAFAANAAQPDPFGITQYAYSDAQIPSDSAAYWKKNCADPNNINQLDQQKMDDWLDSQQEDPNTGEAVATKPNPCLLIQSTVQSAGALFSSSLIPSGAANSDTLGQ